MAQLIFFTGPMNCGKSTLALQTDFTEAQAGRSGRLFTRDDRAGSALISSRIGLEQPAIEVGDGFDFWEFVIHELTHGHRIDYLICDESQFFTTTHVDQLARIVDELQLDVYCFGILTDFRTELFPGTRRLVELCDRMELLQVRPRCWCGEPRRTTPAPSTAGWSPKAARWWWATSWPRITRWPTRCSAGATTVAG